VTSCNLVGRYKGFRENGRLHLQGTDFYPEYFPEILKLKQTTSVTNQKTVIVMFTAIGTSEPHKVLAVSPQGSYTSPYKQSLRGVKKLRNFSSSFNLVLWLTAQRTERMQQLSKLHES
jgi:hypothetical protein